MCASARLYIECVGALQLVITLQRLIHQYCHTGISQRSGATHSTARRARLRSWSSLNCKGGHG